MTQHRESQTRATTGMQRHIFNKTHFTHTHKHRMHNPPAGVLLTNHTEAAPLTSQSHGM